MALIKKKSSRHRIQFSMRPELHAIYIEHKNRAKKLCLHINFNQDFEQWFESQLNQIGQELNKLETEQSDPNPNKETQATLARPFNLGQFPIDKSLEPN